jgi:hypothetical protein
MGQRTRLPDMLTRWRTQAEAEAAVAEARRVVERWNAGAGGRARRAVVADDPMRDHHRHAVA